MLKGPTIAWGLGGIFDAPQVETIAFSMCVEVRAVSGGVNSEGSDLVALGEIGGKESSEMVF